MDTESLLKCLNARSVRYVVIGATAVGGVTFEEVWGHRVMDRIGETPAPFAGLEELIRMKVAAGRPRDLEDLRVLRRLAEGGPGAWRVWTRTDSSSREGLRGRRPAV